MELKDFITHQTWITITETAWFQVALTVLLATLASWLTYVFTHRNDRKKEVNKYIAQFMGAGRSYINYNTLLAEHSIDFHTQKNLLSQAIKNKDRESADIHKQAAFMSQEYSLGYQQKVVDAQTEFIQAGFVLNSLLNKRLSKESFQQNINKVVSYKLDEESKFSKAKEEIENNLHPYLSELEILCNRILWERNTTKLVVWPIMIYERFASHKQPKEKIAKKER